MRIYLAKNRVGFFFPSQFYYPNKRHQAENYWNILQQRFCSTDSSSISNFLNAYTFIAIDERDFEKLHMP